MMKAFSLKGTDRTERPDDKIPDVFHFTWFSQISNEAIILRRMTKIPAAERLFTPSYLRALIIPLLFEQILTITIGMADTIMVAAVGEASVSGISLVDSISNLFIQLFSAFATGGAVVASQYMGRRDKISACKAAKQLVYITVIFSGAVAAILLFGNRHLLRLLFGSIEADVMTAAENYFIFIVLSYPFLALCNSCNALCRSMGKSKITMTVSLIMNIINIGGNAILIYGVGLGTAGAGIASLASRIAGAAIMLIVVCNTKLEIHIDRLFKLEWNGAMVKKILRIGLPSGVENSTFHIGKILVQSLVSTFGTASIAANAVVNNITTFANIPGSVIGLASITVIGQCCGAKKIDQAKYYARLLMILTYVMMALTCLVFYVLTPQLSSLYNLSDEALGISVKCTRMLLIQTAIFWPLSFTLPNYLRAAGDARYTMIVAMASMWTCRIGFSYLLGEFFGMGLYGVSWAMVIDWYCRIIFFTRRWLKGGWKTKSVI